jgi:hypothetical protein
LGGTAGTIAIPDTVIGIGDFTPRLDDATCMGNTNWSDLAFHFGLRSCRVDSRLRHGISERRQGRHQGKILKAAPALDSE